MAMFTLEFPDFNEMNETDCKGKTDYWSYMMTHLEYNYDKGWAGNWRKVRQEALLREKKVEGEARKAVEIARTMKCQGLSVEIITACTNLSIEEIINLGDLTKKLS